jgi:hypothetical protein
VTFTVNASANNLTSNTYVNSISFNNTTNGQGNTTRLATLTVNAPPALQVAPTGNIVARGNEGALAASSFQFSARPPAPSIIQFRVSQTGSPLLQPRVMCPPPALS